MKHSLTLRDGWRIAQRSGHGTLSADEVQAFAAGERPDALPATMPAQVHEVLLTAGRIDDPAYPGNPAKCLWVAESDWVYHLAFDRPPEGSDHLLAFDGLDTIVDVYLNGERIGSHANIYLPQRLAVTDKLADRNDLLLHFHSPHAWLADQQMPAEWEPYVRKNRLLRKPHEDFNDFNGAYPYFTPIGVYGDVRLESVDRVELGWIDIDPVVNESLDRAETRLKVHATGSAGLTASVSIALHGPSGDVVGQADVKLHEDDGGVYAAEAAIVVERPALWWPRGFGEQPLYTLRVALHEGDTVRDEAVRRIGFRRLEMDGRFDLRVNGVPVKLWGANLTPLHGLSHVWNADRCNTVLDLVEGCHMTTLRVWGPGAPYDEQLYDACDRRGILLWSEMYHTWGMYPDSDGYRSVCRAEAEHHVRKFKHHPSVFMWCGGNEHLMGSELMHRGKPVLGRELYEQDYPEIFGRLDPGRYYHPNSPIGGAFANDPLDGDSHGYTHIWYVPGEDYGVLFTENTRVSTAPLRTLRRVLGEATWPEGFDGVQRKPGDSPIPPSWMKLTPGPDFALPRLGPIEAFYDTTNTPEGLVYRLGAAHGLWIRRSIERYRRGRPARDAAGPRRCMGHYLWKLNNTWPMIYSNVIDFYLEPNMAYYALRRAHAPVLACFEIGDHIHAWVVNDSGRRVVGRLSFRLFDMFKNRAVREMQADVDLEPGQSQPILNLDPLGMFARQLALVADLFDDRDRRLCQSIDFADIERHLAFPSEAKLTLTPAEGGVIVAADRFARCVTLSGNAAGDEFGWIFADNYFDLMPDEERFVALRTKHPAGRITAGSQFSDHRAELAWTRSNKQ